MYYCSTSQITNGYARSIASRPLTDIRLDAKSPGLWVSKWCDMHLPGWLLWGAKCWICIPIYKLLRPTGGSLSYSCYKSNLIFLPFQLFSLNRGDEYLPSTLPEPLGNVFWSVVRSTSSNEIIIKARRDDCDRLLDYSWYICHWLSWTFRCLTLLQQRLFLHSSYPSKTSVHKVPCSC